MLAESLFSLPKSLVQFASFFDPKVYPWTWLDALRLALGSMQFSAHPFPFPTSSSLKISNNVYIHPTVKLPHFGTIEGPAFIGPNCELRPGVYIRGNVMVGAHCILGNSCEYKNALLLDHVQTAHFNYVGDSILGNHVHLGAGVILANLRFDNKPIVIKNQKENWDTGHRKLGAIIGDHSQVGCNAVLQPGTVLAKKTIILPLTTVKGCVS